MPQNWWLGATKQQAVPWANIDPDLCHHIASRGHGNLILEWLGDFFSKIDLWPYVCSD